MKVSTASDLVSVCRRRSSSQRRDKDAIALIIVMISIFVLTMLAAGFAYSMRVETRLAMHASNDAELLWVGRSGVDYCRWILFLQKSCPMEQYDSLDQVWAGGYAGGPCSSNGPLAEVMREVDLGRGRFTWSIVDLDRRWSINTPDEMIMLPILSSALNQIGVDASRQTPIVNSILDWVDPNDQERLESAERNYYESQDPPVRIRNGPMMDIQELLLVRGVTPEIFSVSNRPAGPIRQRGTLYGGNQLGPEFTVGLQELFAARPAGNININTASSQALQLIPGVNEALADAIVAARGGGPDPSGMTGPYTRNDPMYFFNRIPGLTLELARQISRFVTVQSRTFEIEVTAHVGPSTRKYYATVLRNGPQLDILGFYWKE